MDRDRALSVGADRLSHLAGQGWSESPGCEQRTGLRRLSDLALTARSLIATAALEQLNRGVALISSGAQLHFANRVARAICREADGLRLVGGRLVASAPSDAARFAMALRRASRGGPAESLRLSRPSARRELAVLITPVSLSPAYTCAGPSEGGAVVWIGDPERADPPPRRRLMESYGLTLAEAGLLQLLLRGCDLADSSRRLGVSIQTARTHLRSVLAKTGTHRQSELMRLSLHEVGCLI